MDKRYYFYCIFLAIVFLSTQNATALNSNEWPIYSDQKHGFRISYPPTWVIIPKKGPNVQIAVSPKDGPGNCNVVMQSVPEINDYSQQQLNDELNKMPLNIDTWEVLLGIPRSQFSILAQKRVKANQVSALYGEIEIQAETLSGKYFGKKIVTFIITPGKRWSVTCGVSTYTAVEGRTRFNQLQPYLFKIMESFVFFNNDKSVAQKSDEKKVYSIESIASQIASYHNKNAEKMVDDMTLSTSAKAEGKNVIITNILKVKMGLTKQELNEFQTELYKEIVPKVCQQNSGNLAFEKGLYYTFVYFNTYKEKLAEIKVDKQLCNGY